jgi:uncharacterized membrane protein YphA (DoxX/SURF4 family)
MELTHETIIHLLVRVILGTLFLFQGFDKLFNIKVAGVADYFREEMRNKSVPPSLLSSAAWFTSLAEFFGGLLVIVGFMKTCALYLLGLDLIVVTMAFSMLKPMWDMSMVFPRLILLLIALYLPESSDLLSIDHLLQP